MLKDRILYEIQKNFPLCAKPYKKIAEILNSSENEVINIVKEQKESGIIRQTSAIYDTKRLGYKSSLVAFVVDEKDIDKAAHIINSHPGVSHNYERNHKFNIWFTLATPPDSIYGIQKSVEILAKLANAKDFIILPTIKLYKIAIKLDTTGQAKKKEQVKKKIFKNIVLNDLHKKVIKYTQDDLPITKEPFLEIAKKTGLTYDELFDTLNQLKESGVMRRFAAILNHRRAGFNANAMVVWNIDDNRVDEVGKILASYSAVSHCYLRPKYPSWQYNIFSMVHGKSKEQTEELIREMESEIGCSDNLRLYSSKEFKKVRVKYFTNDIKEWEEKHKI